MPPEAVIAPPIPTVNQTDSPEQIAHTVENVQKIFDKVSPKIRGTPTPEPVATPEPKKPEVPVSATPEPTEPAPEPSPTVETTTSDEKTVPSFIEKALGTEPVKTEPKLEVEFPEEPTFKTKEESKVGWKNLREAYQKVKAEAEQLRSRPLVDEILNEKLSFLENQNKEKDAILTRLGVENHVEFQNKILRPMQQAWVSAAKIVQEAGGDPNDLAKAMSLSGKAHYDALDSVFEGLPKSASDEAHQQISVWRRLEEQRKQALADAPKTAQALKKADLERQITQANQVRAEMDNYFEISLKQLRDEAKFELLQKSDDPDAKWWNEQADSIIETAKKLKEIGDMSKLPYTWILAASADPLRKLWLASQKQLAAKDKFIRERLGAEPSLSESSGNFSNGPTPKEALKEPFDKAFLREFHRAKATGAR